MNARNVIKRIFFISLWLAIGAGLITLLAAAMKRQNNGHCKDYTISIRGGGADAFIDHQEIATLLHRAAGGELKGLSLSAVNLQQLENGLESHTWIEDAELYFDSKNVMHITVWQKKPTARIFTVSGDSYYIDSALGKLPLSDKVSARLPVFTGFPHRGTWLMRDSMLMREVLTIAQFVMNDPFWMSQVSQIDITPDGNFEMIPMAGEHVVRLGNAENITQKFGRLLVFYKKVLAKTGLNKYPVIDVRYKGQVVATRTGDKQHVDSLQLRKNVEKLLRSNAVVADHVIETIKTNEIKPVKPSVETSTDPNVMKAESVSPLAKTENPEQRIPKAVMPKRIDSMQEKKLK